MESLLNTSYDWNLTTPRLPLQRGKIALAFGVQRIPTLVLINPRGQIVADGQAFLTQAVLRPAFNSLWAADEESTAG